MVQSAGSAEKTNAAMDYLTFFIHVFNGRLAFGNQHLIAASAASRRHATVGSLMHLCTAVPGFNLHIAHCGTTQPKIRFCVFLRARQQATGQTVRSLFYECGPTWWLKRAGCQIAAITHPNIHIDLTDEQAMRSGPRCMHYIIKKVMPCTHLCVLQTARGAATQRRLALTCVCVTTRERQAARSTQGRAHEQRAKLSQPSHQHMPTANTQHK
jgi:hypothetical protein